MLTYEHLLEFTSHELRDIARDYDTENNLNFYEWDDSDLIEYILEHQQN